MSIHPGQPKVRWGWLVLLSIPVAAFAFVEKCSGTALTFTLKKYLSNPAWILCIGSLNSLFAVVIAPWVAYRSDSVRTFLGRRKTFIAAGFTLVSSCQDRQERSLRSDVTPQLLRRNSYRRRGGSTPWQ